MPIQLPEKNRNLFRANVDAESLYQAALQYASFHKKYIKGDKVTIGHTATTLMEKMLAQTKETPAEKIPAMRAGRARAIEDFCYIYGGYIAWKLSAYWRSWGLEDIVEKDELISHAALKVMEGVIRTLQQKGYQKGKFSHLIHLSTKRKALSVCEKYNKLKKNGPVSLDKIQDMVGGAIEIEGAEDYSAPMTETDENLMTFGAICALLKKVETRHSAIDREMFILHRIKGKRLEDIAAKMNLSVPTVSRRIKEFSAAAQALYKEMQERIL